MLEQNTTKSAVIVCSIVQFNSIDSVVQISYCTVVRVEEIYGKTLRFVPTVSFQESLIFRVANFSCLLFSLLFVAEYKIHC